MTTRRRLDKDQIAEIIRQADAGKSPAYLAGLFATSESTIRKILQKVAQDGSPRRR